VENLLGSAPSGSAAGSYRQIGQEMLSRARGAAPGCSLPLARLPACRSSGRGTWLGDQDDRRRRGDAGQPADANVRGKAVKATIAEQDADCPLDHVKRQFPGEFRVERPNRLWVSDFTDGSTWQGFVDVAFVIDAYARRIVGQKVSRTAQAAFVLDALEQALDARRPAEADGLIHHSDRGSQYLSIRDTERLSAGGVQPSVGSVGDSDDNALAETVNGLYKAEVIHRRSWKRLAAVELATLTWVDWLTHRRLLAPIGNVPPAQADILGAAHAVRRALESVPRQTLRYAIGVRNGFMIVSSPKVCPS
jgi:transposase InsO family protein